jgi:[protein-PII] uridylyltransferase
LKSLDVLKETDIDKNTIESNKNSKELLKIHLSQNNIKISEIKKYCNNYYNNYWEVFNFDTIVSHFEIFTKMKNDLNKFKVHLFNESKLQATELLVIAPDHHGLFSLISGLVAASGYDVVSAKIITRSDGYALDTFFIQNKERHPISEDYLRKKLIRTITKGLEGDFNIEKELSKKWEEIPSRFRAVKAPTRVIVDNKTSEAYTILDIKCKNAPGVLYKITKVITSLGLQINTANVSTYGDRVVDIFYLKNAFGSKLDDDITIKKVKSSILEELKEIDFVNKVINS